MSGRAMLLAGPPGTGKVWPIYKYYNLKQKVKSESMTYDILSITVHLKTENENFVMMQCYNVYTWMKLMCFSGREF